MLIADYKLLEAHERTYFMLDELTQQYSTLKTKVHDLREYL
jgi:hypothetical protein